jgi:TRAP-type C4-dicarboxylate transport system substrate-binding protein
MVMGGVASCSGKTETSQTTTSQATSAPAQATKVLKLGVAIPPGDPMVERLKPWIDNFNKAAAGRYELKLFEGGTLAGTSDTLDAVRTGVEDLGHGSIPTFGGHDPAFSASEVPFLLDSYEANTEFSYLLKDAQDKVFQSKFNQKLLCVWCMGFNEFYTVKKQVRTMADVKGLNIAVTQPLMSKSATALGGSPVTMDWPDELPALQKGVVDAGMASISGALAFMKYYEVIKYYIASYRAGSTLDVTINLDVWNKLPADLQKVMQDEATSYATDLVPIMKEFSFVWAINELKKNGVDVYYLPPDERAKWKVANAQIASDYFAKLSAADAKLIQDAAAQANAKYPYKGQ